MKEKKFESDRNEKDEKFVHNKDNKNQAEIKKPKLKSMTSEIDLGIIIQDSYEWTLKVKRCFRPDEYPNKDIFIENIKFSKPRCSKCKANLEEFWHRGTPVDLEVIGCVNIDCSQKNKEKYRQDYKIFLGSIEKRTEGKIRNNFQKYWKRYCDEYDKITNRNYDEYEKKVPYS